jgi:hypothetical protein
MATKPKDAHDMRDTAARLGPQGERIAGPAGPGNIWPGRGMASVKQGKLLFCGEILGEVHGYIEHPNTRDPKRNSVRFLGRFVVVPAEESGLPQRMVSECYLPGVVERSLKAALQAGATGMQVAVEVWSEPDEISKPATRTATGYSYAVYNRLRPKADDSLVALMQQTGIGKIPQLALETARPADPDAFDPETGEVTGK